MNPRLRAAATWFSAPSVDGWMYVKVLGLRWTNKRCVLTGRTRYARSPVGA